MVWMFVKTRPVYFSDFRMVSQESSHLSSIRAMSFHSQLKRFYPAKDKKTILGTRDGTAAVENKCQVAVERFVVSYQGNHDDIGVTRQVFGNGMHNDIGTKGQWGLQVRRSKRIVNRNPYAILFCKIDTRCDVDNVHQRVGWGFKPK